MRLTHLSLFLSLVNANCIIPHKSPHLTPQHHKRDPQIPSNENDVTAGPSPVTIDLPPEWLPAEPPSFLPPPWSPVSDTDSPYPSSGVSPIDDSGRSQMVDNMLASVWKWGRCPEKRVDCSRCPGDKRCHRQTVGGTVISSINPKNEGPPGAWKPPTPSVSPETTGNEDCPVRQCSEVNPSDACGHGAKCSRGYCVCKLGNKGSWHQGTGYRGTEGLSALTVYQNPGVACDVNCDTLSCAEVKQLEKGICWSRPIGDVKKFPWENGEIGPGELDTDTVHSGAVNLPSAAQILGVEDEQEGVAGDYVAGVADMANVNEAT